MFKDRLRQARKSKGHTQQSLADAIGVKKSTVCGYESGNSEPDMDKVIKIMEVLGVDANFLYQDELNISPEPEYSLDALEIAKIYDTLNNDGKNLIDAAIAYVSSYKVKSL